MDKRRRGVVYIISAPSGAGKTSLVRALVSRHKCLDVSVSHTTRKPRPKEIEGEHYHFITASRFKKIIDEGGFIEYAKVFDYYYGTAKVSIQSLIEKEMNVILEIDWQGARQAREIFKENCVSIFILPPSLEVLHKRLLKRAQDSKEVIDRRMKDVNNEISHAKEYDYVIINDNFNEALKDLEACFLV